MSLINRASIHGLAEQSGSGSIRDMDTSAAHSVEEGRFSFPNNVNPIIANLSGGYFIISEKVINILSVDDKGGLLVRESNGEAIPKFDEQIDVIINDPSSLIKIYSIDVYRRSDALPSVYACTLYEVYSVGRSSDDNETGFSYKITFRTLYRYS